MHDGATANAMDVAHSIAALVDLVDYRILRALARAQVDPIVVEQTAPGLPDAIAKQAADTQALFDLVVAHYLVGTITLGRAAEVLDLPWIDLRDRFARVGIPLRLGPETPEELEIEIRNALSVGQQPPA